MKRILQRILSAVCLSVVAVSLTGCIDGNDSETVVTNMNNASVKSLSMSDNSNVCRSLSSYKFTIDNYGQSDPDLVSEWSDECFARKDSLSILPTGLIFNCDSLPKGSIADSIKISMSYSAPSSVRFYHYDAEHTLLKVVNFADTQVVWFDDYAVTRLEIIARDGYTAKNYLVKVNVHQCETDTIVWQTLTESAFDAAGISSQRVDTLADRLCWFVTMDDDSQLLRTADINGDATVWSDPLTVASPSVIDLATLYNWDNTLYAVGASGDLLSSSDAQTWTVASSDFQFVSLLGVQLPRWNVKADDTLNAVARLCAVVNDGGTYRFACSSDGLSWQLDNVNIDGTSVVPESFPVTGFTRPLSVAARYTAGNTTSRLYIVGGVRADGVLTASTWSFDGSSWAEFEQLILPAMQGASIVTYTRDTAHPGAFWILHPGVMADGSVTSMLYFSDNSGVTWKKMSRELSRYSDTSVLNAKACASAFFSPKNYRIFFLGGQDADGLQLTDIHSGVLPDLTFSKGY
ncbi:MAG: hypothetical protein KBT20_01605 [Bacteroidales bacterium]|nr:hypothetical protein [Candidatus Liminaster caballi]